MRVPFTGLYGDLTLVLEENIQKSPMDMYKCSTLLSFACSGNF